MIGITRQNITLTRAFLPFKVERNLQNFTKKRLCRMKIDPKHVIGFFKVFFEFGMTVLFIVLLKSLTYTLSEKKNVVCSKKMLTHDRWLSRLGSIAQSCFLWWAKSNFLFFIKINTNKILIHWNILTSWQTLFTMFKCHDSQ